MTENISCDCCERPTIVAGELQAVSECGDFACCGMYICRFCLDHRSDDKPCKYGFDDDGNPLP